MTTWAATGDLSLDAIETSKEAVIIYNPTRNNTEYFMIENCYKGALPIGTTTALSAQAWRPAQCFGMSSKTSPPSIQITHLRPPTRPPGPLAS